MERLTIRRDHGVTMPKGFDFRIEEEDYDLVQEVLERLAAYEDTGLEPEDISRVFNEVSCAKLAAQLLGTTPERLAELVGADKAGRLVIIPEPAEGLERDLLEPMKVGYALKSEVVKLNMHLARDPKSVSHLDYTIIAALQAVLEGGGADA